jgi:hypothetical protein
MTAAVRPLLLAAALLLAPGRLHAQAVTGSGAGDSLAAWLRRSAGGTSWQPELPAHAGLHTARGDWHFMADGHAFLGYVREATPKGGSSLGSTNLFMLHAARPAGGGWLALTAMGSLETWTLSHCGVPRLLATGPLCDTDGFREYQHPHAPVTELAARYAHPLGSSLALQLFVALVGEPALGPPAYSHRFSAAPDPVGPVSQHETNAAHGSPGVVTAAVTSPRFQLEVSAFDGVPADPDRVFTDPGPLRSVATRASFQPSAAWSLQASTAKLLGGPGHHEGATGTLRIWTASAAHAQALGSDGSWASTLVWARMDDGVLPRHSVLLESAITPRRAFTVFGRTEVAHRVQAEHTIIDNPDGSHTHLIDAQRTTVAQLSLGARLERRVAAVAAGMGARVSMSVLRDDLISLYSARRPLGFSVFASIRPAPATLPAHMHGSGAH